MNNQEIKPGKRKIINKVRRKNKKRLQRLATSYDSVNHKGSGLNTFMNQNEAEVDFDMVNQITMGQNRKMKKKMKKLKKNITGQRAEQKIFKEIHKYKQSIVKNQTRTIFNPVDLMAKRRQKRMKRMEQNAKNSKKQVIHKNFNRS